jgi:ABC-type antimicrobial peptide transport system permease subunit
MLCVSGGAIGTALAVATAKITEILIRQLLPYTPTGGLVRIDPPLVLLTFGVVSVIGLLVGVYPSWRAGRVRPLEAIRSEAE